MKTTPVAYATGAFFENCRRIEIFSVAECEIIYSVNCEI